MIDEIFDFIVEAPGNIWEFVSGMFSDLGDVSYGGIAFGSLSAGLIYLLRDYMLKPFLLHMGSFEALMWGGATYVACAVVGYLVGKRLFDGD